MPSWWAGFSWVTPGRWLLKFASFWVPTLKRVSSLLAGSGKVSRSLEGKQAVLKYGIGQIADICKTM